MCHSLVSLQMSPEELTVGFLDGVGTTSFYSISPVCSALQVSVRSGLSPSQAGEMGCKMYFEAVHITDILSALQKRIGSRGPSVS